MAFRSLRASGERAGQESPRSVGAEIVAGAGNAGKLAEMEMSDNRKAGGAMSYLVLPPRCTHKATNVFDQL